MSEDAGGGVGVERGARDFGAGAKERGADADMGGALLDRDLEVVGHAHGKVRERDGELRLHPVAELAKTGEVGTRVFGLGVKGRHGHEAGEREGLSAIEDVIDERGEGLRGDSVFGGFAGDVDLQEDLGTRAGLTGGGLEDVKEFGGVNRMDGLEETDGVAGLIALEVADEMPMGGRGTERDLPSGFLNLILAEEDHAGVNGVADDLGTMGLRDGDQSDLGGVAVGALGGGGDACENGFVERDKIVHGCLTGRRCAWQGADGRAGRRPCSRRQARRCRRGHGRRRG